MPEIRRAADRFHTSGEGTDTWHSFSFGRHYDPENIGFGPIVAINEEQLAPGAGYDEHQHSDAEIVTWVLEGTLAHEDSTGNGGQIRPGTAQRLSAGTGVTHAERNASASEPLTFVQMMLRSTNEADPQYDLRQIPVGAGLHETVEMHSPARLQVARPTTAKPLEVEVVSGALIHVTAGEIYCAGERLGKGDEIRISAAGAVQIVGTEPAEALVWLVELSRRG
ncbi:MAG TPA: pirin family protein [Aeromicrobium sp.]|nr:pirin family protein [Aeromicrobium sp.]